MQPQSSENYFYGMVHTLCELIKYAPLTTPGFFRKSAERKIVETVRDALDRGVNIDFSIFAKNPTIGVGVLKSYFGEASGIWCPRANGQKLIKSGFATFKKAKSEKQKQDIIHSVLDVMQKMPYADNLVFLLLIKYLSLIAEAHADLPLGTEKMTADNLAVTCGLNILYGHVGAANSTELMDAPKQIEFLKCFIEHGAMYFDQVFGPQAVNEKGLKNNIGRIKDRIVYLNKAMREYQGGSHYIALANGGIFVKPEHIQASELKEQVDAIAKNLEKKDDKNIWHNIQWAVQDIYFYRHVLGIILPYECILFQQMEGRHDLPEALESIHASLRAHLEDVSFQNRVLNDLLEIQSRLEKKGLLRGSVFQEIRACLEQLQKVQKEESMPLTGVTVNRLLSRNSAFKAVLTALDQHQVDMGVLLDRRKAVNALVREAFSIIKKTVAASLLDQIVRSKHTFDTCNIHQLHSVNKLQELFLRYQSLPGVSTQDRRLNNQLLSTILTQVEHEPLKVDWYDLYSCFRSHLLLSSSVNRLEKEVPELSRLWASRVVQAKEIHDGCIHNPGVFNVSECLVADAFYESMQNALRSLRTKRDVWDTVKVERHEGHQQKRRTLKGHVAGMLGISQVRKYRSAKREMLKASATVQTPRLNNTWSVPLLTPDLLSLYADPELELSIPVNQSFLTGGRWAEPRTPRTFREEPEELLTPEPSEFEGDDGALDMLESAEMLTKSFSQLLRR